MFDRYGHDWTVDVANAAELAELKIFELPDFYTVMRNIGATSEFYETNDFSVSDGVKCEREQFSRKNQRAGRK